jgi:hypothetical protein
MGQSRHKTRRKKQEQTKRRFEAIKDLMSTFAMSTVAVVAAVTLIPASPQAEIVKTVALSEEIVYQVQVTDEDNALDLETLYVVLENQLEYYEQPIELGEQSGHFEGLATNTEYRLSVYGNKGFGQERLDTLLITTREKVGGTILSVTPETIDFSTSYFVDISIYDPDLKYSDITLYYGFQWEHDPEADIVYSSIPITENRTTIELTDVFTSEPFHIYLEGTTTEGSVLLDEIWITPPFELYASIYQDYRNATQVGFFVYEDMYVEDISYYVNIYQNERLLRTDDVILEEGGHHGSSFVIENLRANTTYVIEVIAVYTNPQTLRREEQIVFNEEVTTLESYSIDYSIETIGEYYEITITLQDPSHNFQLTYYDVYDTSGEMDVYVTGSTNPFVPNGEEKASTFSILIPTTASRITIGVRNELDFSIKQIIEIIITE